MSFVKRFQTSLESLSVPLKSPNYVVAYSGGVDSHVLLYCCKKLDLPVRAVHVHHGLQESADGWVAHCLAVCEALDIHLDVIYVDANKKKGESPEETARNVRYQALQDSLGTGDCLLTGQHLDDQAETLLLQLFRAANSAGLSAMPVSRKFGDHIHLRPLLTFSRNEIEAYAKQDKLNWIEDPSNLDTTFDRNFIRKKIIPSLEERWPKISSQLSTAARLQSNNLEVLEDMAAIDMANMLSVKNSYLEVCVFEVVSMLSMVKLKHLTSSRLLNLLRYWIISKLNVQPTKKLLEEIENSLINSQQDASPNIIFSGHAFKKFQESLYLIKVDNVLSIKNKMSWDPAEPLCLPDLNIKLKAVASSGEGLNNKLLDESLSIRFRKGGEKFHPVGRRHSQSLKKLLQEANVPPWERDVIPLLYFGDELIAVGELWIAKEYSVGEKGSGWIVGIERL